MNPSVQLVGAMQANGVPVPIINQFTTQVNENANMSDITRYWVGELSNTTQMTDTVIYLNDVKSDVDAWLWHFYERVVPYLKTKG